MGMFGGFFNAIGVGKLIEDPMLRNAAGSGYSVCNFTVVIQTGEKKKEGSGYKSIFIKCVAFGKLAELIEKFAKKGTIVGFNGELEENEWASKKDPSVKTRGYKVLIKTISFISDTVDTRKAEPVSSTSEEDAGDGEGILEGPNF